MEEEIKTEEEKPLSLVEEAKKIRDEILAAKDSLKAENERAEQLKAESLLSGTAGGHIETKAAPEETAKEYADKIMSGKAND